MNKISLAFALVFFIALSFTGCKSTKKVGTVEAGGAKAHNEFFTLMQEQAFKYETLTARLNVDLNLPGNNMSSRVDLKMVKDSAFQLSVQPFLGIEVFRAEISVDSVKVIDRMNKRYVADNYANLKGQTPIEFNFYNLQALFTNRLFLPGQQGISPKLYNRFKLKQDGPAAEIQVKDVMGLLYTFMADGEEKILSTCISEPSDRYALQWDYADFRLADGQPFPMYKAVLVKKCQKLMFAGARNGSRGYIAFAGGLDIPLVMGSKSTLLRNHIGGVEGRKLEKGDTIEFTAPRTELPNMELRQVPAEIYPSDEVVLRVVLGPQENEFTEEGVRKFFWYSGTITNEFDRMGCRIEREPVEHAGDGNINTDGISMGSIQVPLNGQPIIMLADRQSTGGYPKIGTVITVDFAKIAQARPGQKIRFIEVSLDLAQDLYIRELNELNALDERLNSDC